MGSAVDVVSGVWSAQDVVSVSSIACPGCGCGQRDVVSQDVASMDVVSVSSIAWRWMWSAWMWSAFRPLSGGSVSGLGVGVSGFRV